MPPKKPYDAEADANNAPRDRNVWGVFAMRPDGAEFDYTHDVTDPVTSKTMLRDIDWDKVSAYLCTDGFPRVGIHQRNKERYKMFYCNNVMAWLCELHSDGGEVQAVTELGPYFAFINKNTDENDRAHVIESFVSTFEKHSGCTVVIDRGWKEMKSVVEASASTHESSSQCMSIYKKIMTKNGWVFETSSDTDNCYTWRGELTDDSELLALVNEDSEDDDEDDDSELLALVNEDSEEDEEDEDDDSDLLALVNEDSEDEKGDDDDSEPLALVESADPTIDDTKFPTATQLYETNREEYDRMSHLYQKMDVALLFTGTEPTHEWQHYAAAVFRGSVPWPAVGFRFTWPSDKARDAYFMAEYAKIPDEPTEEELNKELNKRHFETCAAEFRESVARDREYDDMMVAERTAEGKETTVDLRSTRFNDLFKDAFTTKRLYYSLITVQKWVYGSSAEENKKIKECNGIFLVTPYETRIGAAVHYGFYIGVDDVKTRISMTGGMDIFNGILRSDAFRNAKCTLQYDRGQSCYSCVVTGGNSTYYVLNMRAVEIQTRRPDDGTFESEQVHVRERNPIERQVAEPIRPAQTNTFSGMTGMVKVEFQTSSRKRPRADGRKTKNDKNKRLRRT